MLKEDFYKAAVTSWSCCRCAVIPKKEELLDVHFRKSGGELVPFESAGEWVDNNHPLWQTDRDIWLDVLQGRCEPYHLPLLVSTRWGNQRGINLSHFPTAKRSLQGGVTTRQVPTGAELSQSTVEMGTGGRGAATPTWPAWAGCL